MPRALALLLALVAYVALWAVLIWLAAWTAPSLVGWLDEILTPAGVRALPVAITAVLALVIYFVWLGRRDAARPSSG